MATRVQVRPATMRRQVTSQETFDYTTPDLDVVASPVDPVIQPQVGSGLRQLVQALGPLSQGLQAYSQDLDRRFQQDVEKGRLARATGQPKPTKGQALIQGWETLDGELAARRDYRSEVTEFLAQNIDTIAPDELEQGLREIAQKYLNGATEDYVKGFVPTALQIEEGAIAQYQVRQQELLREEGLNKLSQKADDEVNSIVQAVLSETFGLASLDDILGDEEIYDTLNRGNFGGLFADRLRQGLSAAQELGKTLGFNRNDISEIYLDKVGQVAVDYGLPELLDFAEKRDKNGVSIAGGTLGDKVRKYREQAEAARTSYIEASDRKAAQDLEQQRTLLVNETRMAMANLYLQEDPVLRAKGARQIRERMASDPLFRGLSSTTFASLLDELVDLEAGQYSFPSIGNDNVFADLRLQAIAGELTIDAIQAARASNDLTMTQFNTLLQDYEEQEARKDQEAAEWEDKASIFDVQDSAIALIAGMNEFGLPEDQQVAVGAKVHLLREIKQFQETNGRPPNYHEYIKDILSPTLQLYGFSIKDVLTNTGNVDRPSILDEDPPQTQVIESEPEGYQKIVNFLAQWIPFVEPIPNEVTVIPGASFTEEQAYENLNKSFAAGNTKQDVEKLLTSIGEPADAVDFYFRLYAFNVAKAALRSDDFSDPIDAIRFINKTLTSVGFDETEIQEAINAARYPGEEEKPEDGTGTTE